MKMKVRLNGTTEWKEYEPFYKEAGFDALDRPVAFLTGLNISDKGKDPHVVPTDFFEFWKEPDWEQRRYEVAKNLLPQAITESGLRIGAEGVSKAIEKAISVADLFIEKLKNNSGSQLED